MTFILTIVFATMSVLGIAFGIESLIDDDRDFAKFFFAIAIVSFIIVALLQMF